MNLQGIVSVSGKPGLFKLIGQNKTGFIIESLDAQKTKTVVNLSTSKMASLTDITIFGEDEDIRLEDILQNIRSADGVPDIKKASGTELRDFFRSVAPDHDEQRVYSSDIKKIISWFGILKDLPLFSEESPESIEKTDSTAVESNAVEEE